MNKIREIYSDESEFISALKKAAENCNTLEAERFLSEIKHEFELYGMDAKLNDRKFDFLFYRSVGEHKNAILEYKNHCNKLARYCRDLANGDASNDDYANQKKAFEAMTRAILRKYSKMQKVLSNGGT